MGPVADGPHRAGLHDRQLGQVVGINLDDRNADHAGESRRHAAAENVVNASAMHDLPRDASLVADEMIAGSTAFPNDLGSALTAYDPIARCEAFPAPLAREQQFAQGRRRS